MHLRCVGLGTQLLALFGNMRLPANLLGEAGELALRTDDYP
jgi:hypothetical protein